MSTKISPRTRSMLELSDLEITLPDLAEKGGWRGIFCIPDSQPVELHLEIGIGKDAHLVERAAQHPDQCFIGIEHSKKKLNKVHAKAIRKHVKNIRFLRADIFRVLDPAFSDHSIQTCYMFFPDPWPKKRHSKFRMVQMPLVDILAKKIAHGAAFELRTDHGQYSQQMLSVLDASPHFDNELGEGNLLLNKPHEDKEHIPTLFETKFRQRGIPLHYLYYRRNQVEDGLHRKEDFPPAELIRLNPMQSNASDEFLIQTEDGEGFEEEPLPKN